MYQSEHSYRTASPTHGQKSHKRTSNEYHAAPPRPIYPRSRRTVSSATGLRVLEVSASPPHSLIPIPQRHRTYLVFYRIIRTSASILAGARDEGSSTIITYATKIQYTYLPMLYCLERVISTLRTCHRRRKVRGEERHCVQSPFLPCYCAFDILSRLTSLYLL